MKGNNGGETGDQSIGDVLPMSVLNCQQKEMQTELKQVRFVCCRASCMWPEVSGPGMGRMGQARWAVGHYVKIVCLPWFWIQPPLWIIFVIMTWFPKGILITTSTPNHHDFHSRSTSSHFFLYSLPWIPTCIISPQSSEAGALICSILQIKKQAQKSEGVCPKSHIK